jgi:hypothetical protein
MMKAIVVSAVNLATKLLYTRAGSRFPSVAESYESSVTGGLQRSTGFDFCYLLLLAFAIASHMCDEACAPHRM